jgi:hypothetical protein
MKMAAPDFAALKAAIEPLDTAERRQVYREGKFARAELVKDLDTRYRWDLYWQAGGLHGVLPDVTHDYKDAHIDTALRNIVAPLRNATPTEEGN